MDQGYQNGCDDYDDEHDDHEREGEGEHACGELWFVRGAGDAIVREFD